MKLKKITLIRPNMGNYRSIDAFPPLAIAILAARTPKTVKIKFYDDRIEEIPKDDFPDMVALSVETFTAKRAYQIASEYSEKGVIVVMGGYHPTFLPEEVLEYADSIVIGDAEGSWENLLNDFENDDLKRIYTGGNEKNLDDYKMDRSIFKGKEYAPVEMIQYSRGCKYSCEFCSIATFYKNTLRNRNVESMIKEIKGLNKKKLLFFADDNLFSSRNNLLKLLEGIKPLKVKWACQISIDIVKDDELLDAMARSGCVFVLIGFESLSPENLKQMGKKWNNAQGDYLEIVRKIHNKGMSVYGTFVFGYDHDDLDLIDKSVDFAFEADLEIANFNPLTPTPGSKLYDRLKSENKLLLEKWWLDEKYRYGDPIFTPKLMTPEEFTDRCFEAKKRFYSWKHILKRTFLTNSKFCFYRIRMVLIANILSRREVKNKQHRFLGK